MATLTPEQRALGWTIEFIATSESLTPEAKLKIMSALSPDLREFALPDVVQARLILDALRQKTERFARVHREDAEFVFESLVTVGDIARRENARRAHAQEATARSDVPEPPLHLTAMSYCETVVSRVRGEAPDVVAFCDACELYDLEEIAEASPWLDRRTLENLQAALMRDAEGLTRGDTEIHRVLEKHHASSKLCFALAHYVRKVVEALGPAFLRRVAADARSGTYAPAAETRRGGANGSQIPTGVLVPEDVAGRAKNLQRGLRTPRDEAEDDREEEEEEEEEGEEGEEEAGAGAGAGGRAGLVPEKETSPRKKRLKTTASKGGSRVVELAKAPPEKSAWQTLAKHAEGGELGGEDRLSDEFRFRGSDEDEDASDPSPGAEAARRRRGEALTERIVADARGGTTVAWGSAMDLEEGAARKPESTPGTAARGTSSRRKKPSTPGSPGRTYTRWTRDEETYLLRLCEKHGEGNWALMLAEWRGEGKLREGLTSVHLKDKFRNLTAARPARRPAKETAEV